MRICDVSRDILLTCASAAILASCTASAGNGVSPAPGAGYAFSKHRTFKFTGGTQTFTVPEGVTQIRVTALGGNGANAGQTSSCIPGGYGGRVSATLAVTPKEQLVIYVGGNGSEQTGGFNGGADGGAGYISASQDTDGCGGGGASDVRTAPGKLSDRILVAGGGAGAGAGLLASRKPPFGGKGGNRIGGSGGSSCKHVCGGAGSGGTQKAGGSGGTGQWGSLGGSNGALGAGGAGAGGQLSSSSSYEAGGGGGGGGGYYGGGGGAGGGANSVSYFDGGGGGGGSSYVEKAIASDVHLVAGAKSARRVVTIDW